MRGFGESIREVRKEKNMSQANLSEILGVSKQAVSKWERGVCLPDIELRYDISEALNIPIEMLLFPFSNKYFPYKLKPSDSEDETVRTFFELQEDEAIEEIYMQESYYQLYRNCLLYNPIFALPDFLRFFLIPRLSHFPKEKDFIKILKGKRHMGKLEKIRILESPNCKPMIASKSSVILSKNRSGDDSGQYINENMMVIGGCGSGKTQSFVKPNILQMNASFVIFDVNGHLLESTGTALESYGYKIKVLDLRGNGHSLPYNPLSYVRDIGDVIRLVDVWESSSYFQSVFSEAVLSDTMFLFDSAKFLLVSCISYLVNYETNKEKVNLITVYEMIKALSEDIESLDHRFYKIPEDATKAYYKMFRTAASKKTQKDIAEKCLSFLEPIIELKMDCDRLGLEKLSSELTALFIISGVEPVCSVLTSTLFEQTVRVLCYEAEQKIENGEDIKENIPVRIFMDEFGNIGKIPDMPCYFAFLYRYRIYLTCLIQSVEQIKAVYPDDWECILGCCEVTVFLGNGIRENCEYLSKKLNQSIEIVPKRKKALAIIRNILQKENDPLELVQSEGIPADQCLIFLPGERPFIDKKYDLKEHPLYHLTADADPSNSYMR